MNGLKKLTRCLIVCGFLIASIAWPAKTLGREDVKVPILMYHKVSKAQSRLGKYTITPGEFEADLKYLKENGFTTVTMTDLVNYVHNGDPLPDNPIVITIDDGAFSDYRYVFPLLQQYEMKAVISIIGSITDEYTAEGRTDITYPHLLWSQIKEMVDSGCVEVQNHGYDLHSGCGAGRIHKESDKDYELRLSHDISHLQDRAFEEIEMRPNTFTYPFGEYNDQSDEILRKLDFSASLICLEKVNTIAVGDDNCLFGMGRILRPHGKSCAEVLKKYDIS